ncbi:hypothetical protein FRC07_013730 [Ceratobasidium sp. 392]|nr:hypothetical protein FRC07_013730 [Ceratobasidium sp. 392]
MKRAREARSRLIKAGDHSALQQWENDRRQEVQMHDEFGEMLQRYLIYPEITLRQKKEMELPGLAEAQVLGIVS